MDLSIGSVKCTDIAKACYEEPITDTFVIITEDKDFSCAIKVLTDNGKDVILVTEEDRCIHNLEAVGVNLNRVHNMEIEVEHKIKVEDKVEPMCTCFFKVTDGIKEVPFYNGIRLQELGDILRSFNIRKHYSRYRKLYKICEDNLLKVENGKVYFRKEWEYAD